MEVAVDQRLPVVDTDVEETVEVGLQSRKPRHQYSETTVHGLTKADYGDGEQSENSAYLDENGGAVEDLDIHKIASAIQNQAIRDGKAETAVASREETGRRSESIEEEEVVEEEVVELEFEKVIPKLHTHTMHCPNCDARITKVVLRRKIIRQKTPPITTEEPREPVDLLGCLSCFSLFTSSGNGRFNPFPIWNTTKPASNTGVQPAGNEVQVSGEEGNCFSVFKVLWKPRIHDPDQQADSGENEGSNSNVGVTSKPKDPSPIVPSHLGAGKQDTHIDIPAPATSSTAIQAQTQRSGGQESKAFEILKSIVYGGSMEVIASLSVVASAAAADATTLSIVSLALANLIGGIFIIGHNIWDLRNDCYKISNNQQTNEQTRTKYKELLGQVENFPLHMFLAVLSFLVFGIIPPVAYGYAFHETNDKDFTLLVVLGVSMVCVGLLAIIKAYVDMCGGFWGYAKTIVYYLISAIMVSGVSYVIGNLVTRAIEKLGLFELTHDVNLSVLPDLVSKNTGLAYY